MEVYGEYFYGNKVSDYGLEHGYVDYATFAKAFEAVMANTLMEKTWQLGEWEQISGFVDNTDEIEELREQIEELEADTEQNAERIAELELEIAELECEEKDYPYPEVFQWFIVSSNAVDLLREANEVLFYHYELDLYLWGVTHYGTSWDYVLTDIKCNTGNI